MNYYMENDLSGDFPDHCGRCACLEAELEAKNVLLEAKDIEIEKLKKRRRVSSPTRAQPVRQVVFDERQESIRAEIVKLQADLLNFAGRGGNNSISAQMKLKILGSLTKNSLSMRQIQFELDDLSNNIEYFKRFEMPSTSPIQSVAYSVASLNLQQSISFLESSEEFMLCFDGSTKSCQSIQGVVLINERGTCHCIDSFVTTSGTAEVVANAIGQSFINVALAAEQDHLIEDSALWSKTQIRKISMIMSDSCPAAIRTKKNLVDIVRDMAEDENMVIFVGDCSMHLVSNAEKKLIKCLSPASKTALNIINEVLASDKGMVTFFVVT